MNLKQQITNKFLQDKPKFYIIKENEQELIDLMDDVIKGIQEEKKYLNDNYKRVLNEKLNLEEIVDEQNEKIKILKKEIERLK
jgi:hypothetical protein